MENVTVNKEKSAAKRETPSLRRASDMFSPMIPFGRQFGLNPFALMREFTEEMDRVAAQYKKEIRGLTHRTQILLSQYSWPGNVRELENVIGHAAMMTMSGTIDVQDLPAYLGAPF